MTPKRDEWQRVSRRRRCPICDKPDWCLITGPARNPTAVICARIESEKRCGEAGWLHRLRDDESWQGLWRRVVHLTAQTPVKRPDVAAFAEKCAAAIRPDVLQRLADELGLSVESLRRLRVGWSSDHRGYTFPMCDAEGDVLGIRLRTPGGRKLSVRGGREGMFIPDELQPDGRLLICEGPTDAAALVDLRFAAVGRPSCHGGIKPLIELVSRLEVREAVIVADGDGPGRRGAESLALILPAYAVLVRLIEPPSGIKDARAWKRAGATAADVDATIAAASVRKLNITTRKAGEPCKPMKG